MTRRRKPQRRERARSYGQNEFNVQADHLKMLRASGVLPKRWAADTAELRVQKADPRIARFSDC